jgi:hypothetical protein
MRHDHSNSAQLLPSAVDNGTDAIPERSTRHSVAGRRHTEVLDIADVVLDAR